MQPPLISFVQAYYDMIYLLPDTSTPYFLARFDAHVGSNVTGARFERGRGRVGGG